MAGDPYARMSDIELFNHTRDALLRVQALPPGTAEQAVYQAVFDTGMLELGWRAVRHVLAERESVK